MARKKMTLPRVLAIASTGGHWTELWRLRPAWADMDVAYVTTAAEHRDAISADAAATGRPAPRFYEVVDANRWQKLRLIRQAIQILMILLRERPGFIVSTGAAPGFFALRLGKWLGAKTVWIDSIANAEELSLSGLKANGCADLYLTQWENLQGSVDPVRGRPEFSGTIL